MQKLLEQSYQEKNRQWVEGGGMAGGVVGQGYAAGGTPTFTTTSHTLPATYMAASSVSQ